MSTISAANPLLHVEFQIPFDQIRAEHVEPAVAALLSDAEAQLGRLTSDSSPRTFANTMEPLDALTERLDYAVGIARHLEAVATTPALRAAYNAVQPPVSAFYSSLPLNEPLWRSVQEYSKTEEAKNLSGARKRFLEKTVDNFRRHGAELDASGKKRIAEIDIELSKLTIRFSENVLDSTNEFELVIADEEAGRAAGERRRHGARQRRVEGPGSPSWRFTLQAPSYVALMTYLDDAGIRRQVYEAYVKPRLGCQARQPAS
jgi:oligopeptidase A